MPALAGRIKRLEVALHVRAGPCSECGRHPSGWDLNRPMRLTCSFGPPETKRCSRCGALTVYALNFESPKDAPL